MNLFPGPEPDDPPPSEAYGAANGRERSLLGWLHELQDVRGNALTVTPEMRDELIPDGFPSTCTSEVDAASAREFLDVLSHAWPMGTPAPTRKPFVEMLESLEIEVPADPSPTEVLPDPRRTAPRPPGGSIRIGQFQIVGDLGRGGCGVVSLAVDTILGRQVALKVPWPEYLSSAMGRRRFLVEARAAAKLDHPNVVPVYDAGEDGPICYIASAFCEGSSLAAWLAARLEPVPPRQAAWLVAAVADGVQHAHDADILHRDLKPGNILLQTTRGGGLGPASSGPSGDRDGSPGFVPRVADFGLAKLLDQPGDDTIEGTPLGSPPYMSPEQAVGRLSEIGAPTDVYGLGAILYDILTGRPPFRGATRQETLRLIETTEPAAPRSLRDEVPRDLETICLKCLCKVPSSRYATAQELADDLRRFLAGKPIDAKPPGICARGFRWICRNPLETALAFTSALCVVMLGVFLGWRELALQREAFARVSDFEMAPILDVPRRLEAMRDVYPRAVPILEDITRRESLDDLDRVFRAKLGLLPYQADRGDEIFDRMLTAEPGEHGVLRDLLRAHWDGLLPRLRAAMADPTLGPKQRLRAASAWIAVDSGAPWHLLRHSDSPQFRTDLIHWLGRSGVEPSRLMGQLRREPDPSIRRALIQALGESHRTRALRLSELQAWLPTWTRLYREDPDSGVHQSLAWLLGVCGQIDQRDALDRELAASGPVEGFHWFLNSQGQTMVILRPLDGAREDLSQQIDHNFAIAGTEVTWRQYREYDPDYRPHFAGRAPGPDEPIHGLGYHDAVGYCEWLNRVEGLDPERGYRMPTMAEWLYASLAGATTECYFGDSDESIPDYVQFLGNTGGIPQPVAQLKPNDFGLFDTLGNVNEWCSDPVDPFTHPDHPADDNDDRQERRATRGGSVVTSDIKLAANTYIETLANGISDRHVGFRVAIPLPEGPPAADEGRPAR